MSRPIPHLLSHFLLTAPFTPLPARPASSEGARNASLSGRPRLGALTLGHVFAIISPPISSLSASSDLLCPSQHAGSMRLEMQEHSVLSYRIHTSSSSSPFHFLLCLKNCTSRSCFSAAPLLLNVPRLRPVDLLYSLHFLCNGSFLIIMPSTPPMLSDA